MAKSDSKAFTAYINIVLGGLTFQRKGRRSDELSYSWALPSFFTGSTFAECVGLSASLFGMRRSIGIAA